VGLACIVHYLSKRATVHFVAHIIISLSPFCINLIVRQQTGIPRKPGGIGEKESSCGISMYLGAGCCWARDLGQAPKGANNFKLSRNRKRDLLVYGTLSSNEPISCPDYLVRSLPYPQNPTLRFLSFLLGRSPTAGEKCGNPVKEGPKASK